MGMASACVKMDRRIFERYKWIPFVGFVSEIPIIDMLEDPEVRERNSH